MNKNQFPLSLLLKLFISLWMIFQSLFLVAQTWAPEGAVWHYNYSNETTSGYLKIESVGDTIIEDKTCRILQKTRVSNNGFSSDIDTVDYGREYMYQEDNVVYRYKLGQFYVLYDFAASVSDSWIISSSEDIEFLCDTIGVVIADSVSNINLNGLDLNTVFLNFPDSANWIMYGWAYERIGHLHYMFPEPTCIMDYYEGGSLRCYYDPEFGLYKTDTTDCEYIYMATAVDEQLVNNQYEIYPNPVSSVLSIKNESPVKMKTIELVGLYGNVVYKLTSNKSAEEIDVRGLSKGCYILRIVNANNAVHYEKLMIR